MKMYFAILNKKFMINILVENLKILVVSKLILKNKGLLIGLKNNLI